VLGDTRDDLGGRPVAQLAQPKYVESGAETAVSERGSKPTQRRNSATD
jgi:hypothetical protein